MYNVIRFYQDKGSRVIKRGLTLEQARAHCRDKETSSSTCSNNRNRGQWFDGYTEVNNNRV